MERTMKSIIIILGLILAGLFVKGILKIITKNYLENNNYLVVDEWTLQGIDISHHQGNIKWESFHENHSDLSFVYIKATEGSTIADHRYQSNFKGAKKGNILVGSYHYFTTQSTPENQFKNFSNQVNKEKQDLVPMIDVEQFYNWSYNKFHRNLRRFLILVEKEYGKKPIIYTSNNFYNKYLIDKYDDYLFSIARYSRYKPYLQDGKIWFMWQYSDKGNIKGISKKTDLNIINSNYSVGQLKLKNELL